MKLTNGEIFNTKTAFEQLITRRFPVKTSYALVKTAAQLNGQFQIIERVRSKLIQQYGREDSKRKGLFNVTPDCPEYSQFLCEFGELMKQEVDLPIEPVVLPDNLEIEPSLIMALDKFIKI